MAQAQGEASAPRVLPQARLLSEASRAPAASGLFDRPTYSFQISLLLADVEGEEAYVGLSKNAQKALEDLKDFLPFKSYRLLDFAWLRTSHRSSARVKGADGSTYELTMSLGGRFGDVPSTEADSETDRIYISNFDLRDVNGVNLDVEAGPLRGSRSLISTSFGMTEGETVVVGTSNLGDGQEALVVLLTAVPSSLGGG